MMVTAIGLNRLSFTSGIMPMVVVQAVIRTGRRKSGQIGGHHTYLLTFSKLGQGVPRFPISSER